MARHAEQMTAAEPIFTRNFILASLASFAAFCSFHLLLATLPLYVVRTGAGEAEVVLVLDVFAPASDAIPRPGVLDQTREGNPLILRSRRLSLYFGPSAAIIILGFSLTIAVKSKRLQS